MLRVAATIEIYELKRKDTKAQSERSEYRVPHRYENLGAFATLRFNS
jgi:hypothetical protein